jgi:hypothetical protein
MRKLHSAGQPASLSAGFVTGTKSKGACITDHRNRGDCRRWQSIQFPMEASKDTLPSLTRILTLLLTTRWVIGYHIDQPKYSLYPFNKHTILSTLVQKARELFHHDSLQFCRSWTLFTLPGDNRFRTSDCRTLLSVTYLTLGIQMSHNTMPLSARASLRMVKNAQGVGHEKTTQNQSRKKHYKREFTQKLIVTSS